MKNTYKTGLVLGLALFAMFFGAGNLIFPTSVGLQAGDQWFPAMVGFLLTGVGLPLLGIFSVIKIGGSLTQFARKLGDTPSKLYGILVISSLALVAVSRTAATTFEMSIQPILPNFSPIISSIIFFGITLLLVFNPNGIIDRIGKILTPVLLVMLTIIIIKGVVDPIGLPKVNQHTNLFTEGFFGGYQTMDALGSVMLGGIIIASLLQKDIVHQKEQQKITLVAIAVAGIGLALVYGGLLYLGSTSSQILSADLSRTQLTISIVELILGNIGKVILGICVMFACLTTAVGVTATVGDFYQNLSNGKLKYKYIVTFTCILCGTIANFGVEMIVQLATPLLIAIYPITILLIALNLLKASKRVTTGGIIGALIISIFEGLSITSLNLGGIMKMIQSLPLAEQGFAWVLPAILGIVIGIILDIYHSIKKINQRKTIEV